MDEEDDDMARMRAFADQAREGLKEFAHNIWTFNEALRDHGFDRQEAMALCMAFLVETMQDASGGGGEGEQ